MVLKKGMVILIAIAIVLAVTAISLRLSDSNEVPTDRGDDLSDTGAGRVGVTILQTGVEDKLADNSGGNGS